MLLRVTALPTTSHRIHPAWWVAAVTFLALVGAAAFRAVRSPRFESVMQE